MGTEDVIVFHHQRAKDDLFEDLGDIFYLLRLLHVLVQVDIGEYIAAQRAYDQNNKTGLSVYK